MLDLRRSFYYLKKKYIGGFFLEYNFTVSKNASIFFFQRL